MTQLMGVLGVIAVMFGTPLTLLAIGYRLMIGPTKHPVLTCGPLALAVGVLLITAATA